MSKAYKPKIFEKKKDDEEEGNFLLPDKNNQIKIAEIPDPEFDMKYYQFDIKDIQAVERDIRRSFEFKALFQFIKKNLNVDHCSFYKGYSMKNGLTIELHHSPFTLFDITEACMTKALKNQGYYETFRIVEEVIRLHYEFKVGLTPLNPTAHRLVHSDKLKVHPKIVIGFWKDFFAEYSPYFGETAMNNYNEMLKLEKTDPNNVDIPEIMNYNPVDLVLPIQKLNASKVEELIVGQRIKRLEGKLK